MLAMCADVSKVRWPTTKHTFMHVVFWSAYYLLFSRWTVLVRVGGWCRGGHGENIGS